MSDSEDSADSRYSPCYADPNGRVYDVFFEQPKQKYSNTNKLIISSIPNPFEYKNFTSYRSSTLDWQSDVNKKLPYILPVPVSVFFRRPLNVSTHKITPVKVLNSDNLLEMQNYLVKGLLFDLTTTLSTSESKPLIISRFIRIFDSWKSWKIPQFPIPEIYENYEDFEKAADNWFKHSTIFLSNRIRKYMSDIEELQNDSDFLMLCGRKNSANKKRARKNNPMNSLPIDLLPNSDLKPNIEKTVLSSNQNIQFRHNTILKSEYFCPYKEDKDFLLHPKALPLFFNEINIPLNLKEEEKQIFSPQKIEITANGPDLDLKLNEPIKSIRLTSLLKPLKQQQLLEPPLCGAKALEGCFEGGRFFPRQQININNMNLTSAKSYSYTYFMQLLDLPFLSTENKIEIIQISIFYISRQNFDFLNETKNVYKINACFQFLKQSKFNIIYPEFESLEKCDDPNGVLHFGHRMLFRCDLIQILLSLLSSFGEIGPIVDFLIPTASQSYIDLNDYLKTKSEELILYIHSNPMNETNAKVYIAIFCIIGNFHFPDMLIGKFVFGLTFGSCFKFFSKIEKISLELFNKLVFRITSSKNLIIMVIEEISFSSNEYHNYMTSHTLKFMQMLFTVKPSVVPESAMQNTKWVNHVMSEMSLLMKTDLAIEALSTVALILRLIRNCRKEKSIANTTWNEDVSKIQTMIFAYLITDKKYQKKVAIELNALCYTLETKVSLLFFFDQNFVGEVFAFLTNEHRKIRRFAWKIMRRVLYLDVIFDLAILETNFIKEFFLKGIAFKPATIEVVRLLTMMIKLEPILDRSSNKKIKTSGVYKFLRTFAEIGFKRFLNLTKIKSAKISLKSRNILNDFNDALNTRPNVRHYIKNHIESRKLSQ